MILKRFMATKTEMIRDILTRGVSEIIGQKTLEQRLQGLPPMTVYLGVDPTGADIHLGHAIHLRKLRALQKLGHKIILLIGDFTGRIGDPTDRDAARKPLTHEQVIANAKKYKEQAGTILDFTDAENPVELRYNAEWLDNMSFREIIQIASHFTVQQFLERDMYQERIKAGKPIHLHEFLYPLMQGYDSVVMGVDMEVGGSDQLFNMLAGRSLVQEILGKEKIVMTSKMLEGTDGRKMSKSYNNIIAVKDAPQDMFGKLMSINDELIGQYFELATDVSMTDIEKIMKDMKAGKRNPRDVKFDLAADIVTFYHGAVAAEKAAAEFNHIFKDKKKPDVIPTFANSKKFNVLDVLVESGLLGTKNEARRAIEQGGVKVNDQKITSWDTVLQKGDVLQVGKRKFLKIT